MYNCMRGKQQVSLLFAYEYMMNQIDHTSVSKAYLLGKQMSKIMSEF